MKRFLQFGLVGFATTAAITGLVAIVPSAIAQTPPVFEELELTDEQREEISSIFEERREDISNILTDEQRQQFQDAFQELRDFRAALAEVDTLTDDQRTEIRGLAQESRDEISEILTDEQREELRSIVQERRQGRREREEK